MLNDLKINEFLEKTAAGDPTPGGGGVAALNAALAAGLTEMVANLTIDRKQFEPQEDEVKKIAAAAVSLREKLQNNMDDDSEAYKKVMMAYQFPKDTEAEKTQRARAIQNALKNAARVPLGVAKDAFQIMKLAQKVIVYGNPNAAADGAVAVMTARSAALASIYNVKINLGLIKDRQFVEELMKEVEVLENQVLEKEEEILKQLKK